MIITDLKIPKSRYFQHQLIVLILYQKFKPFQFVLVSKQILPRYAEKIYPAKAILIPTELFAKISVIFDTELLIQQCNINSLPKPV